MKRHKFGYRLPAIRRMAVCALCCFGIGVMSSAVAQVSFTRITEGEISGERRFILQLLLG